MAVGDAATAPSVIDEKLGGSSLGSSPRLNSRFSPLIFAHSSCLGERAEAHWTGQCWLP